MDNEIFKQVTGWLESVFDGPIPQYEICPETIDILHNLMKSNQQAETFADLLIEDLEQKSAEYAAETQYYGQIFSSVNVRPEDLSPSTQSNLRVLTDLAATLNIKDGSDTSYLLAITSLKRESLKLSDTRKRVLYVGSQLYDKTKLAQKKASVLERNLQLLEEQCALHEKATTSRVKEAKFMRGKAREYAKTIQAYQAKIPKNYVSHESLVEKSEFLQELKNKLVPLKSRLNGYHSLPPNINLTKVKIEEVRREVANIERDLADIVSQL